MILITGGIGQGKHKFAADLLHCDADALTDGCSCELSAVSGCSCITDYHILVRRLMDNGIDPVGFTEKLCSEYPDTVVVMDEIGCGIVPLDRGERIWRENTGRCGCIIADNSHTVIRMVCGIPISIKGELP